MRRWRVVLAMSYLLLLLAPPFCDAGRVAGHGVNTAAPPRDLRDIPAGWSAFVGVLVGSLLTGGMMLLADLLRHRRLRRERLQELLLAQRIAAYGELMRCLAELVHELPLIQTGLELLRWPKNQHCSPRFFEEPSTPDLDVQREDARRTDTRLVELARFVHSNPVILAARVQFAFWEAFSSFSSWRIKVQTRTDQELGRLYGTHLEAVMNALENLYEATAKAIEKDLAVSGFTALSQADIKKALAAGREKVKRQVAGASEGIGS